VILDIGGTGVCSFWLAEAGYSVHLGDPTDVQIEAANRINFESANPLASCRVGDARTLDFGDATADAILLLGPLYHLTESQGRLRALAETARVLKPGGLLFAAAISRFASVLD
jgi:ubiquinone/menaquinone biosynthesis C-methylase UbiE